MNRAMRKLWKPALAMLLMMATLEGAWAGAPAVTLLGVLTGGLRSPGKLAVDAAGNLLVADARNGGIVRFDPNGRPTGTIKIPGVLRSVAVAPDGKLLVSHDAKVGIYAPEGALLKELSGYAFAHPNGIALDPAGNVYVADSKSNQIAVFSADGTFRNAFGRGGKEPGELNFPTALAFEQAGNMLAVVDTMNNRIQFFTPEGVFRRGVGGPGVLSGPLSFTYPDGVAFDYTSGLRMYVSDGFQNSVQAIDLGAQPRFAGYLGGYGPGEGEFLTLSDVLFDQQSGTLITADASGAVTFFALGGAGAGSGDPSITAGGQGGAGSAAAAGFGRWGFAGAGSAGTGTGASGGARGGSKASWNYPTGADCRHGRAGSVLCR
jgi:hypothetical protein